MKREMRTKEEFMKSARKYKKVAKKYDKIKDKYEAVLPEALRNYYTKAGGLWGEMIDKMTDEQRTALLKILEDTDY